MQRHPVVVTVPRAARMHTSNQSNRPVQGRFISARNKCKHQQNDLLHLQQEVLPAFQHPHNSSADEQNSSMHDSESDNPELDEIDPALDTNNSLPAQKDTLARLQPKRDLRSMLKSLKLHPQIHSFVCCPKCYSMYKGKDVPMACTYKPLGQNVCDTSLFKSSTNFSAIRDKGIGPCLSSLIWPNELNEIDTPKCVYYSTGIANWVEWLLQIPNIEKEIDNWADEAHSAIGTSNIQPSLAWKSFIWSTPSPSDQKPL
ncbi:hypothetical protein O181_076269 [Austropuccinia psidii MF-1]|uniref:Uncharacterized protein n=1 Tax=Austropuccinia psidii MF-1 TaxID=1389203 RepID=A0A9Q3FCL8_9BASI|nr:hypothetical protein [Austropuccinia psidii MF-1]